MSTKRLLLVIPLLLAISSMASDNLIINGDFDQDLSHWAPMETPAPVWQTADAFGDPKSGSALAFRQADLGGGVVLTMGQCINFEPGLRYFFGAMARKPSGQSVGVTGRIVVQVFGGPDCTLGNPITHLGGQVNTPDWSLTQVLHPLAIPSEHASAMVSLGIASFTSDPLRTFEFDAVYAHSDRIFRGNFDQ